MDETEEVTQGDEKVIYSLTEDGSVEEVPASSNVPLDMEEAPVQVWSIQHIWNESLRVSRDNTKVRDYISMSDIGKDFWNRYQKMMGVPETNPFDPRVLRIFQAGDEFHNLVKGVMKVTGFYINSQDDLDANGEIMWTNIAGSETRLPCKGRYDMLVGGKPNLDNALRAIESSELTEFGKEKAERIARHFVETIPQGLKPLLYEIKSVNSQAFWAKKKYLIEAYPHHRFQLYGYLKGNNIEEGRMLYVSKDDLTVAEFPVRLDDPVLSKEFEEDVNTMSHYYLNKIEPPKPKDIKFNPRKSHSFTDKKIKYKVKGCFEPNWEVARSSHFTLMTGFGTVDEWENSLKAEISEKNKWIKEKVLAKVNK